MKILIIILVTLFLVVNVFGKEIVKQTTSKLTDDISSLEKENLFFSNGRNSTRNVVASGLYFYVVVANDYYPIKKMILLK